MLLACSLAAMVIIFWALLENKKRSLQQLDFELTPNCLMTRHPLVFVTGKRSLFYFAKYWNCLPMYLAEHGYDVFTLTLPWRKTQSRTAQLKNQLSHFSKAGEKYHLFFDSSSLQEIVQILNAKDLIECIASLTLVSTHSEVINPQGAKPFAIPIEEVSITWSRPAPLTWRLHSFIIGQQNHPAALGLLTQTPAPGQKQLQVFPSLLDRAHLLAERDLTKNSCSSL